MADNTDTITPTLSFQRDRLDAESGSSGDRSLLFALLAIVVFSVAFGGGGSKYGLANLIAQLAALIALGFHGPDFARFWKEAPLAITLLIAATVLLPLAYAVPLPPGMWQSLPGRELVVQSFDLVGTQQWASISVDPIRTLLAAAALITPLAVLSVGWGASRESLILVGWAIVALALANFAIGIPQVLSNSEVAVIYPENPMPGVLFGTFANRNSTGIFLVSALALAAALPAPQRLLHMALPMRVGIVFLLIVAILLTRSRTALVLAVVPLGMLALQVFAIRAGAVSKPRRMMFILVPIALIVTVVGAVAVAAPGRIGDVAERFGQGGDDARAYIWEDALFAADRYWPVGSGTGTFDDVFQVDESLENLTLRKAGRAHNDYLEIAIEAGLPGLVLVGCWLLAVAWLCWRVRSRPQRWIAWSGGVILAVIAAQSVTDYPLRNLSMLAVAGYAFCLLLRFGPERSRGQEVLP